MVDNVVSLHNTRSQVPSQVPSRDNTTFPQDSNLYFRAVERPLTWQTKQDAHAPVYSHKVLLRAGSTIGSEAIQLAIVGSKYKLVQNKELFHNVEDQFTKVLAPEQLKGVKVVDSMAYNGRTCIRQYLFPNMRCLHSTKTVSDVAFRTVVVNGFGGSSIKLYTGAIDFFCSNGMISGQFDTMYVKHTSGLMIGDITDRIKRAIDVYYSQQEIWASWIGKAISMSDAVGFFENQFPEKLAAKLSRQFAIEANVHGRTVWALYSTMTYYASHNEGEFALRKTGNDHEAVTLLHRENDVKLASNSEAFMDLTA